MSQDQIHPVTSFFNVIASKLSLEDFDDLNDLKCLLPIMTNLIQTGQLDFVSSNAQFGFHKTIAVLRELGTPSDILSGLQPEAAEGGDPEHIFNILIALIYQFRQLNEQKYAEYAHLMNRTEQVKLSSLLSMLGKKSSGDDSVISNNHHHPQNHLSSSSEFIHQSAAYGESEEESIAPYKIKVSELESKLKQMELLNSTLNEQLSVAQSELSEMEGKHEGLNSSLTLKQNTVDELQQHVKDLLDDMEVLRYDNSQLQRELKNANEKSAKSTEKYAAELKSKEGELALMYRRLDDYVKQLTEKETVENRLRFLDQQLANAQGVQKELKEELEKALGRANTAETELIILKKQVKTGAIPKVASAANLSLSEELEACSTVEADTTSEEAKSYNESNVSLHEELNGGAPNLMLNEELARLKTRLELMESENKQLERSNAAVRHELAESRSAESQSVMEKALEIERLKQECETLRDELGKNRQREARDTDRCAKLEESNKELLTKVQKLEESLDKARKVIEVYSTASEGYESAADVLNLRHENERLHAENQRLLQKMDQFRHEATQEQRLITSHWYKTQLENFQLTHGLETLGKKQQQGATTSQQQPNNNPKVNGKLEMTTSRSSTESTSLAQHLQSPVRKTTQTRQKLRASLCLFLFMILFYLRFFCSSLSTGNDEFWAGWWEPVEQTLHNVIDGAENLITEFVEPFFVNTLSTIV